MEPFVVDTVLVVFFYLVVFVVVETRMNVPANGFSVRSDIPQSRSIYILAYYREQLEV